MKSTKIILNEDVYNLGEEGDVREVAPGYARNFLFPKGLAVLHSRENVARFQDRKAKIDRRKEEKRTSALGLKDRIEEMELEFEVPAGASGKLFGSVSNAAIADRLLQAGVTIERKKIEIPGHTFKMIGDHEVTIKLYADESASLKVRITPEGGEAKGAAKGKSTTASAESEQKPGKKKEPSEAASKVEHSEEEFSEKAHSESVQAEAPQSEGKTEKEPTAASAPEPTAATSDGEQADRGSQTEPGSAEGSVDAPNESKGAVEDSTEGSVESDASAAEEGAKEASNEGSEESTSATETEADSAPPESSAGAPEKGEARSEAGATGATDAATESSTATADGTSEPAAATDENAAADSASGEQPDTNA